MTDTFKIQFTPQEANKRLPLVRQIVEDILKKAQQLQQRIQDSPAGSSPSEDARELQEKIRGLNQELEDLGCYFKAKNADYGLVHFPSVIGGNPVYLCWRSDEEEVRYFHSHTEDFSSRKEVPNHYLN